MQIEKRKEKQKPISNGWHASFWYVAFVVVYKVLTTITFRKIGLTNVLPSITIYIWRAMLSYCLIQLHIIHNSNKSITNFKKTACDNPSWGGVAVLCVPPVCVHLFFGCFFLICLLNIPSVHSTVNVMRHAVLVCQGLFMDVCQSQRFMDVCQKVFVPAIQIHLG